MLKSAKLANYSPNDINSVINNFLGNGGAIKEIEIGIYMCPHHNFHNDILDEKDDYFDFHSGKKWYSPYGVCDTIKQVKKRYSKWLNDPNLNFCISFTSVKKSDQSVNGGWRWHKWGEYIGTKDPQCEYLYDEGDDIKEVYCFHIYQLLN